jgi:hypothetical protein
MFQKLWNSIKTSWRVTVVHIRTRKYATAKQAMEEAKTIIRVYEGTGVPAPVQALHALAKAEYDLQAADYALTMARARLPSAAPTRVDLPPAAPEPITPEDQARTQSDDVPGHRQIQVPKVTVSEFKG